MSDEDALLRAICEQPDEDTPRLVFADWLSEQGGPLERAWAHGIRSQIWHARGESTAALTQQSRLFDSAYGQEKLHEHFGLQSGLLREWERGFPACASAPFAYLQGVWPNVAFRLPIQKLTVYEVDKAATGDFVTWPALTVLRELTLQAPWESPVLTNLLPILAGCPSLTGLESLRVDFAHLDDEGLTAILDSPYLADLKQCELPVGYEPHTVSIPVRDRFRARFGPDSMSESDAIPF